jgi:transcriptional regulator with XRE-family HTH domain
MAGKPKTADGPTSEGQRLLQALDMSYAAIADAIGTSKQSVSNWHRGKKVPAQATRKKLQSAFGIDPKAWDSVPSAAPKPKRKTSKQPAKPKHASSPTTLAEVNELLARLRTVDPKQLTPPNRTRHFDTMTKVLSLKHRIEQAMETSEDRMVRESPFWRRTRKAILAALKEHPEAAADVAKALKDASA